MFFKKINVFKFGKFKTKLYKNLKKIFYENIIMSEIKTQKNNSNSWQCLNDS